MSRTIGIVSRDRSDVAEQVEIARELITSLGARVVNEDELSEADAVLVLGGDGTILKTAHLVKDRCVPILGVNFGHVGFLAEAESDSFASAVRRLVDADYSVDERLALNVTVEAPDGELCSDWALNEVAILKVETSRMIELAFGVDGDAVSSYGCDAFIISSPTGSTAYAFSAGGPIIWPTVEALLVTPIAAHALFTRPMVTEPSSTITVRIADSESQSAQVYCDSQREIAAPAGSTITVTRAEKPVLLARLSDTPFAGRLVSKFNLPVHGWRVKNSLHAQ